MRLNQTPMPPTPQSIMRKANTNRVRNTLTQGQLAPPLTMPPTVQPNTGRLPGGTIDPIYPDPIHSAPPVSQQPWINYQSLMQSAGRPITPTPIHPTPNPMAGPDSFEEPALPIHGPGGVTIEPGLMPGNNLPPIPIGTGDDGGLDPSSGGNNLGGVDIPGEGWDEINPIFPTNPPGAVPRLSGGRLSPAQAAQIRARAGRTPISTQGLPPPGSMRAGQGRGTHWDFTRGQFVPNDNATGAQFNSHAANLMMMAEQARHQPTNFAGSRRPQSDRGMNRTNPNQSNTRLVLEDGVLNPVAFNPAPVDPATAARLRARAAFLTSAQNRGG